MRAVEPKPTQRDPVDKPLWSDFKPHEIVIVVLFEVVAPFVGGLVVSLAGNAVLLCLVVLLVAMFPAIDLYGFGILAAVSAYRAFDGRPLTDLSTKIYTRFVNDIQFARYMVRERTLGRLKVIIPSAVVFIAASGQFFRCWNLDYGGFVAPPAISLWAAFWDWTRFSASWAIDNLLANFGQIFGLDPLDISPVSQEARIVVFAYNIVLVVIVLKSVAQFTNILRRGDS
jgi:hypothetical protein